jgi:AraC-like DNA-binding protein
MKAIARYVHLRAPYFRLRTGQRGDRIALVLEPLVEMNSEKRRPLLESVLLSFQGLIETALQRPMSEGMFDIAGPGTPAASRYSSLFHAPVRFDAPETTVAMPSESLPVPNPLADPRAFADAISELDAMERHFLQGAGIVDRVERALEERDDEPSLGDIAASLKVSPRTLERLLRNSQTSFRALLEERRRRHAERLLRDETLTIAEVAYRLGFADPANFTRACRRWFGISPSGYRGLGTMPTDA